MKTVITTIGALALAGVLGAGAFIYLGIFNVAASEPHWPVTYRIMETAGIRSIRTHARGIKAPENLGDPARIVSGTAHFADHCATCHSAPGVEADDMAEGMYPKPPALTNAAKTWTPSELFWIVKNGIKMSGMPSWADHGSDDLWSVVAFLEKLPGLSDADYGKLFTESAAAGGHVMHPDMPMKMDMQSGAAGDTPEAKK
jgi:mono/diheme cytochrome c family protein